MRYSSFPVFLIAVALSCVKGHEIDPLPSGTYAGAAVEFMDMKGNQSVPGNVTPVKFEITNDYKFVILNSKDTFPDIIWKDTEWTTKPVHGVTLQLLWEKVNDVIVVHFYANKDEKLIGASKIFCQRASAEQGAAANP